MNETNYTAEEGGALHIEVSTGLVLVLAPITILIIGSNAFVIHVICTSKDLQNVTGYMMISLAVADLGMGFSTALPLIYVIFSSTLTSWACDVMGFLHSISWVVSVFILALLSVDRYVAIQHPLHYERLMTTRRTTFALVVIWLFGVLLWSLPLGGVGRFKFNDEEVACYFDLVKYPWQWITYSLVVFVPTSGIIIISYTVIWKVSKIHRAQIEATMSEQVLAEYRKKLKPAFGLILIIGAFFIAWLPFFIEHLVKAIEGKLENVPEWLEIAIFVLAMMGSFWNPLIYMRTNSVFRQAGSRLLNRFCPGCGRSGVSPEQMVPVETRNIQSIA